MHLNIFAAGRLLSFIRNNYWGSCSGLPLHEGKSSNCDHKSLVHVKQIWTEDVTEKSALVFVSQQTAFE